MYTISLKRGNILNEKADYNTKKYSGKSSVVSARLPDDMIKVLDEISFKTGKSRNELLVTMIEFAIDNIEIVEEN